MLLESFLLSLLQFRTATMQDILVGGWLMVDTWVRRL
jgi:hypothetical protein